MLVVREATASDMGRVSLDVQLRTIHLSLAEG